MSSANGGDIEMLPWLTNWWEQTENPSYAWEALARWLAPDAPPSEPLPLWVREYFRDAAVKMYLLSIGQDFRRERLPRIAPEQAAKLVGEALGLVRERSKHAFARRADDGEAHKAALDARWSLSHATKKVQKKRGVEVDSAHRFVARGKKLDRAKRP